jgi:hypothetical protein
MSSTKKPSLKATFAGVAVAAGLGIGLTNPYWVDPQGASQTLENAGYSNIKTEGYSWFGCGKGDLYHTEFKATSANGKEVSGVVCKGVFKGSTIRFD